MAVTADSVVVELIAKTDGYTAAITGAASTTSNSMSKIEESASRAERQIVRSGGAIANAQRNLGRQISDIGTQVAGGQSPFLIIAQQAPQVADALADTGGKAAAVASFFAGPWGAALLAAGSALGILVGKMLETGDTVESLVAKLQSNEERTKLAAEADRIFAGTQAGLSSRIRATTDALNEQNASLRTNAQLRNVSARAEADQAQRESQQANERLADAQRRLAGMTGGALGVGVSDAQIQRNARQIAQARQDVADATREAQQASINLNRSRVFLARENARANATPEGRLGKRFDNLADSAARGAIAAADRGAQVGAATERVFTYIERAREKALEDLRESEKKDRKSSRKGPSAETLARRAEVARVREVRNNEAFNSEYEQLNQQIIAAQRERANTASEAAVFDRQDIESDYRKRKEAIAADLSAKKYSATEAADLNERNETVKALRLRGAAIDEDVRTVQEIARINAGTIEVMQEDAQSRLSIAETLDERRKIELELIGLKYRERKEQLEALRSAAQIRGDIDAVAAANQRIDALLTLETRERAGVDQRYRGRFENYRRGLSDADSLRDSIDDIKIQTLEAVTDELTNATKAALGLKGAFGDIVGELIRIGIQRRLIGPLADSLFGKADGSTTGAVGGFLSGITRLFGRASGGYVGPGQTVRVNEGRGSGVELLRMGAQGGTVIPLGQANATARPRQAGTTVIQNFSLDMRGGMAFPEFVAGLRQYVDTRAVEASKASYGAALRDTPTSLASNQSLKS